MVVVRPLKDVSTANAGTATQKRGGSALKRLRSSLRTAGAIGPTRPTSKKKKAKGVPTEAGRNELKQKLQLIREEMNPFEIKTTKVKFDILGRKVKGVKGKPGLTKQIGDDNRKNTLLVELKNKNRAGGIVDRRFGENDLNMTPEEKMLERFTKERQKKAKSSLFNLEDDDDMDLTHYGQSLSAIDDFDATGLSLSDDDENDKGAIDSKTVSWAHFGGFDDVPDGDKGNDGERRKSKAEIMKEVMAKSKLFKYERQKGKEEDEGLRQDLDNELDNIRELLEVEKKIPTGQKRAPLPSQTRTFQFSEIRAEVEAAKKADLDPDTSTKMKKEPEDQNNQEEGEYEDYDRFVRELAMDRRVQPTDRLKTEEEIAAEEREKLEQAEKARKRRMEGIESESEEEQRGKRRRKGKGHEDQQKKIKRVPIGDDLEDGYFDSDEENNKLTLGKGLSVEDIINSGRIVEAYEKEEDTDDNEEDTDDNEEEDGDDNESDDDENFDEDISDLEFEERQRQNTNSEGDSKNRGIAYTTDLSDDDINDYTSKTKPKIPKSSSLSSNNLSQLNVKVNSTQVDELPYMFPCPTTYDEFLDIIKNIRIEDLPLVIHRIRILYHIKLGGDNKAKMENFYGILLIYILNLSERPAAPPIVLAKLTRQLYELTTQLPEHASVIWREHLIIAQKSLHKKLSEVPSNKSSNSQFFDRRELVLFRVLGLLWSTSDFHHPIATPASLLLGQSICQSLVRHEGDLARGLATCQVIYDWQTLSKRYFPEVINFILCAIVSLSPQESFPNPTDVPGTSPLLNTSILPLDIHIEGDPSKVDPELLDFDRLLINNFTTPTDEAARRQLRVSLLAAAVKMLDFFSGLWSSSGAFIEVFGPSSFILYKILECGIWSEVMTKQIADLHAKLLKQLRFAGDFRIRRPLQLQNHKPVPIAMYLPKFEEKYSIDRHYDPDSERAQTNKLKHQYKKERKGAIRELRKDNMFIAREKVKEQKEKDEQYKKYVTGVMSTLEGEQSEKKRLEKIKVKESKKKLKLK